MKVIDLKKKNDMAAPCPASSEDMPEYYYPTLYLSDIEGVSDIPMEGYAKIKYKVTGKDWKDRGKKKRICFDLEVQSIEPMGKVKSSPNMSDQDFDEQFEETMEKANKKE